MDLIDSISNQFMPAETFGKRLARYTGTDAGWTPTTWFSVDPFRGIGHPDHPHGAVCVCAYDPRPHESFHTNDIATPDNPAGAWGA